MDDSSDTTSGQHFPSDSLPPENVRGRFRHVGDTDNTDSDEDEPRSEFSVYEIDIEEMRQENITNPSPESAMQVNGAVEAKSSLGKTLTRKGPSNANTLNKISAFLTSQSSNTCQSPPPVCPPYVTEKLCEAFSALKAPPTSRDQCLMGSVTSHHNESISTDSTGSLIRRPINIKPGIRRTTSRLIGSQEPSTTSHFGPEGPGQFFCPSRRSCYSTNGPEISSPGTDEAVAGAMNGAGLAEGSQVGPVEGSGLPEAEETEITPSGVGESWYTSGGITADIIQPGASTRSNGGARIVKAVKSGGAQKVKRERGKEW